MLRTVVALIVADVARVPFVAVVGVPRVVTGAANGERAIPRPNSTASSWGGLKPFSQRTGFLVSQRS